MFLRVNSVKPARTAEPMSTLRLSPSLILSERMLPIRQTLQKASQLQQYFAPGLRRGPSSVIAGPGRKLKKPL